MSTTPSYPETNLIKKADLARAREIDFVWQFNDGIKKLLEALGVTRKIPKQQGTTLKAYKAVGTLENGAVAEGDLIPLSKYEVVPVTFAEITLKKWRKATSAEAIVERGYDQAHDMTSAALIKDVQKGIKNQFFAFLATGTGSASGNDFQAALAQAWAQLQILFEDTDIEAVYFMNQLDVADYLADHSISLETAFGMTYLTNFLGLGTVIFNSNVPKGTIYATAKDNIILYYIPVNGAGLENAFEFTSDETGYIGVHEGAVYNNMTDEDVAISGVVLFAERLDGIVVASIGEEPTPTTPSVTLNHDTATVAVGSSIDLTATTVPADAVVTWTSSAEGKATVVNGTVTGVAEGETTITASITVEGQAYTDTCTVTVSAGA